MSEKEQEAKDKTDELKEKKELEEQLDHEEQDGQVEQEDFGKYFCKATNNLGSQQKVIELSGMLLIDTNYFSEHLLVTKSCPKYSPQFLHTTI